MTRMISSKMQDMIEAWEGCILTSYPDPGTGGDPWTIGYGHTGKDVHPGMVITQIQADHLLSIDLTIFENAVAGMAGPNTADQQFDALVSFAYNCGSAALHGSTLLKLHLAGNYAGAAAEFPKWDHPTNLPGILRRRQGEAAVYLNGDYGDHNA